MTTSAVHTEQDLQTALEHLDLGPFGSYRFTTSPLTADNITRQTSAQALLTYGWTPADLHALAALVNTWNIHPYNKKEGRTPTLHPLANIMYGMWPNPSPTEILPWLQQHGDHLDLAVTDAIEGPQLTALIHKWNRAFTPPLAALAFRAGLTYHETITAQHHGTLTPDLLAPLAALTQHQADFNSITKHS